MELKIEPPTKECLEWGRKVAIKHGIMAEILEERDRQDDKWGEQNHSPSYWFTILMEEVGEAARAVCEWDMDSYREEMIQVAAVAMAIVECHDRNKEGASDQGTL